VFTTVDSPPCLSTAQNQTCVATDIQNTVTHEIGHALGLDHNTSSSSTMFNSATTGDTTKRTVDPGSQQFVCDVYPKGGAPRDCIIDPAPVDLGQAPGCASIPSDSRGLPWEWIAVGLAAAGRALRGRRESR